MFDILLSYTVDEEKQKKDSAKQLSA